MDGGLRLNLENIVKYCQKYGKILSLVTYYLRKRFFQAVLKARISLPSPIYRNDSYLIIQTFAGQK